MSFLLRDRLLGRAILKCRPTASRHFSQRPPFFQARPLLIPLAKPRFSTPPILSRPFTSTVKPQHPRPYPHRQQPSNDRGGPKLFSFLDRISQDAVFWGIITINGVVFVMWYMSTQRFKLQKDPTAYKWMINNFTGSWRNLSSGRIWTIVTSCFSHENIGHILFNGFTFFFMARPVLSMLASRQFIFLYLGGGIFANIASMLWSNLVKGHDTGSHGASAAIYSVVSFLACVAPRMSFQLYGIIPIPAWLAVAGIFTYDTYSAINDKQKGVDTAGHVAGLFAGAGYYLGRRYRLF